jgi:hypothetical protein
MQLQKTLRYLYDMIEFRVIVFDIKHTLLRPHGQLPPPLGCAPTPVFPLYFFYAPVLHIAASWPPAAPTHAARYPDQNNLAILTTAVSFRSLHNAHFSKLHFFRLSSCQILCCVADPSQFSLLKHIQILFAWLCELWSRPLPWTSLIPGSHGRFV